jgi:hypothetical protein
MVEAVGSFQGRGAGPGTTRMRSTGEEAQMEESLVFSETIKVGLSFSLCSCVSLPLLFFLSTTMHLLCNYLDAQLTKLVPKSASGTNIACHLMQLKIQNNHSMQDLKTLRSQLYSAAEYFELSYIQEDGKQAYVIYPLIPLVCCTGRSCR